MPGWRKSSAKARVELTHNASVMQVSSLSWMYTEINLLNRLRISMASCLHCLQATDAEHGAELWRTDGTGAGTVLVKDIFPGESSGAPAYLTPFGDYLYFQVSQRISVVRAFMGE